jgi:Putative peptidoglycan binding domain
MTIAKSIAAAFGVVLVGGTLGCGALSQPFTERERDAGIGALAGGTIGAIIGSVTGSALAGGLIGMPLGAVAGFYVGDQLARADEEERMKASDRDREIERLRRENERLRRESEDVRPRGGRAQSSANPEQSGASSEQIRQAQRALNSMGYDSGPADGVWNARTQAAVRDFQQTRGLEATGQLNERTMRGLGIDERAGQTQQAPRSGS